MRISRDNPHPMAPLNGINSEGGTVSDAVTGTCWRKSGDLEEQKVKMSCLARVQKLSIELWLILHVRQCG